MLSESCKRLAVLCSMLFVFASAGYTPSTEVTRFQ